MTSDFPNADIDSSGRCKWCRAGTFPKTPTDTLVYKPEQLIELANHIRENRSGKYDCVIGVSGGLDSSYVVYITKELMGLNPLLVQYDHGFFYDSGKENLREIVKTLAVELRLIHSSKNWDHAYIRSIVKAFDKTKLYWGICSFCHYILPAAVAKIAHDEGIKYIMISSNDYEVALHVPKMVKIRAMLTAVLSGGLFHLPKMVFHLVIAQYYLLRLKLEFFIPPITNLFRRGPKVPMKKINLTEFVPWDTEQMQGILSKEANWKTPNHPNLGMRFDCMIEDSFINLTYKRAIDSTIHTIIANNLIYDGKAEKAQLENVVAYYEEIIEEKTNEVLQKIANMNNEE